MPDDNDTGSGDNNNDDEGNEPQYVTVEQLNAAMTGRFKGFEKSFSKTVGEQFATLSTTFTEQLQALKPPQSDDDDDSDSDSDDDDSGAPPGGDNQDDAIARAVAKAVKVSEEKSRKRSDRKIAELTKRADTAEAATKQEHSRAQSAQLEKHTREALAAAGVDSRRMKHALGHLVKVEGRVKYDDIGDLVWVDDDGDEVSLKAGVAEWAKTDDAKLYLPPRGASGSGDQPRNQSGGTTDPNDRKARNRATIMHGIGG